MNALYPSALGLVRTGLVIATLLGSVGCSMAEAGDRERLPFQPPPARSLETPRAEAMPASLVPTTRLGPEVTRGAGGSIWL